MPRVNDGRAPWPLAARDDVAAPARTQAAACDRREAPAAVLARARDGDPDAFRELFRAHRGDVTHLLLRLLGRTAEIDDLVQEVFLQVHRSLKDFRGGARFSTWLYRVTVNVVLMHRRAARSRPLLVGQAEPSSLQTAGDDLGPDEAAARNDRLAALRRLLDRLSEKKRTVWVLHELHGVSPVEIAQIVRAPVLTVRTRLFYARRDLAALLDQEPALAALAAELGRQLDGDGGEAAS